jgi:hypothetical protein
MAFSTAGAGCFATGGTICSAGGLTTGLAVFVTATLGATGFLAAGFETIEGSLAAALLADAFWTAAFFAMAGFGVGLALTAGLVLTAGFALTVVALIFGAGLVLPAAFCAAAASLIRSFCNFSRSTANCFSNLAIGPALPSEVFFWLAISISYVLTKFKPT